MWLITAIGEKHPLLTFQKSKYGIFPSQFWILKNMEKLLGEIREEVIPLLK